MLTAMTPSDPVNTLFSMREPVVTYTQLHGHFGAPQRMYCSH